MSLAQRRYGGTICAVPAPRSRRTSLARADGIIWQAKEFGDRPAPALGLTF